MPFKAEPPPTVISLGEVTVNPAATMSDVQPSTNPIANAGLGLGPVAATNLGMNAVAGPEVPLIAGAIGVVVEYVKNRSWWREASWTVPLLVVLSFGVAFLIWYVLYGDALKAMINGSGILTTAHVNWAGSQISGVGVFRPTADANRWVPPAAAADPTVYPKTWQAERIESVLGGR